MPDIIANVNDGTVSINSQTSHANARDADSGTATAVSSTIQSNAASYGRSNTRGGGFAYSVRRSFFYFDTSTISSNVTSATLRFRGQGSNSNADIIVMKSDAFGGDGGTALADTDFNAIVGQTDGESMAVSSGCVEYSGEVATWNTSDINSITLTAAALSDMESDDFFIIALIEFDHDYKNVDFDPVVATVSVGLNLANISTTDKKPTLRYNLGYGNDVLGLALANISKINNLATANVGKVNSLD